MSNTVLLARFMRVTLCPFVHPWLGLNSYAGYEPGGVRKAAVRETTGPLKSWLHEHRKNPYPTKAEKIMLAIITQMTLTQVRLGDVEGVACMCVATA